MIGPRSLEQRFEDIERRLDDLRPAQTPFSSDAKDVWLRHGSLFLQDDGAFTILDVDGDPLATFDRNSVRFFAADGSTVVAQFDRGGIANQIVVESEQTILAELELTTTSFTQLIDVDFTIPASWSEYSVSAWWVGTYSDTGGTFDTLELRAVLDSSNGDTRSIGMPEPVERRYPISHIEVWSGRTATGSRNLKLEGALVTGGGGRAFGIQNQKLAVSVTRTG